jgi:beta-glucosidase
MAELEEVESFDAEALNRGNRGIALSDPELDTQVERVLARMTLAQKAAYMRGASITAIHDLYLACDDQSTGRPPFKMVDGPRGVRAGVATTFPVAMARGASWDVSLEERVGEAIALEARAHGANVLLAPAVNLLRHPGWGRAQETYGEDPLHVGRLGFAFIAGAQRHLVASVKHFALNSIENNRFDVDVRADARTLRETYLPHFELCVRGAHVGSVMSAYNKVNGSYCGENEELFRILKREWGFRGFVESDWILGTRSTVASAKAGLDLEMPQENYYGKKLFEAVQQGKVSPAALDDAVRRLLRVNFAFGLDALTEPSRDVIECGAHGELALEAAHKSTVLLKNERGLLPLRAKELKHVVLVGSLANTPNTGDRGSSDVHSSYVVTPLAGLTDALPRANVEHVQSERLDAAAERAISAADVAVVVVGLTFREEGENIPLSEGGGDRVELGLPHAQQALIMRVAELNPRTVVVVQAGSAVTLSPWIERVPAVFYSFYAGMLGGEALADLLLGRVSPSAKLPISFARAEDLPPFDPRSHVAHYERDIGYMRLLDRGATPERPFGFGLGYGKFAYRSLTLEPTRHADPCALRALVEVENVGGCAADEVVQLYATKPDAHVPRAVRWLVGFGRLSLKPGERKRLSMRLDARSLAHWDVARGEFVVEAGNYIFLAGESSLTLPLEASFRVTHGV